MQLFHGTDVKTAQLITGPPQAVDVTKGGGELGRGFYAGDSLSLAVSWANGRYGLGKGKVIEINVDNSSYAVLNVKTLSRRKFVYLRWRYLALRSAMKTFLFGYDVVCAPFATISMSLQIKFESATAQNMLNNKSNTNMRVL